MRSALDVFWETVLDWWNGMVGLVAMNFLWFVMSLTLILLPPATAGIYVVTHSIAHGTGGRLADLWPGMRQYAWLSYEWALANIIVGVVWGVGFAFYGSTGGAAGKIIQAVFAMMGLLWLTVQFYTWPFLIEQEQKSLRIALRNALFLALASPVYMVILLGAALLIAVVSILTVLPAAVFLTSFVALLGNRAVIERLRAFGKIYDPRADEPLE